MPDSVATQQPPVTSTADTVTAIPAVSPDSAAAETRVIVNALEKKTCQAAESPRYHDTPGLSTARVAYAEGIAPQPRAQLPGYDSGVMTMLIVLFLIITANCRHYSTFIKTFTQNLFSVRKRANVFDDNQTMSETRVLLSLIALVCVSEGILLFSAINFHDAGGLSMNVFSTIGAMTLLAVVYYVWQLLAYRTTGYMFSTRTGTRQWLKGFNASQSLLGLGLTVPAVLSLFNPGATPLLLYISLALYGAARIIFICKGFRIFYSNYGSILYFILYLCTLEIIPPVLCYRLASHIVVLH